MKPKKNPDRRAIWQYGWRKWLLLILLTAAALRFYDLAHTPPGLTHDEADHGVTAWQIVNGVRAVYFTVGYGREPLFDYSTALLMTFLGPTFLAGRLAAIFFGLLLIAGTYNWVRRAFNENIALLTAAGLAVGFWSLMTSRQTLRSETLPALFVLAIYFFWRGLESCRFPASRGGLKPFVLAGVFLGLTFYTYIPARLLWTLIPVLLTYLALVDRPLFQRLLPRSLLMLAIAVVVGSPLFAHLLAHPGAEERIWQLIDPLAAFFRGDRRPLLENALGSLRLFTLSGDTFWRYNIPGKPFLQPLMGLLFYLGLALALWRVARVRSYQRRTAAYFLAVAWLLAGLAPVLVTGPELSTTQAIGLQPVLYLFPAIGLAALFGLATDISRRLGALQGSTRLKALAPLILLTIFGITAGNTAKDYFVTWANAPEVRVQYESTMVAAMDYLNAHGEGAVAVSTIGPNRFHSPAVAAMTLHNESVAIRWFDGRQSLVLPTAKQSNVLIPGFTPIAPALMKYFETAALVDTVPLRPTDQDRPLQVYRLDGPTATAAWTDAFGSEPFGSSNPVAFGDAAEFLGYDLLKPTASPGETVRIATLWRLKKPLEELVLFTHILGPDGGTPIAQADRLDAPSDNWHSGDLLIQLHQLEIPLATTAGEYPIAVGICQLTTSDCSRLPIRAGNQLQETAFLNDLLRLSMLTITK